MFSLFLQHDSIHSPLLYVYLLRQRSQLLYTVSLSVVVAFTIRVEETDVTADTGCLLVEHYGVTRRICAINWTDEDAVFSCKPQGYAARFSYIHSHLRQYPAKSEVSSSRNTTTTTTNKNKSQTTLTVSVRRKKMG